VHLVGFYYKNSLASIKSHVVLVDACMFVGYAWFAMLLNKHECDNVASPWGLECTELCYHAPHVPSQCTALIFLYHGNAI
jgi:hypothetical protein